MKEKRRQEKDGQMEGRSEGREGGKKERRKGGRSKLIKINMIEVY